MDDILLNIGMNVGIPAGVGVICLLVARLFPKKKALSIAKICRKWGKLVSKTGNTKLGKKSMDKFEEGPIATILGFIGMCIYEFSAGLAEDNIKEEVKKKVDPDISEAFNETMEKL